MKGKDLIFGRSMGIHKICQFPIFMYYILYTVKGESKAPYILNFGTSWRRPISFIFGPFTPTSNCKGPIASLDRQQDEKSWFSS